ncbi:DUF1657 domain-containing protein [Bacillus sp. S/N-304-OC-R1]|uniref:DUF1657 domain-containing protein n=1 Tax=Bacillus sp. S/N-304-OC-R1 TaxID=2758034 RepID=UPI001C8DBDF2|nr:DUF1657 domain-containing protein [Bacillus sp. S/N-304-OC-R1]MBY0121380.1 DUF1657 domain-containing protein [Bacillus sp. S/N-304-OC-R1]
MTVISNVKQSLSTIRGIEAQLSILAINSLDPEAQRTFHETMNIMNEIKKDLQIRVNEMMVEEPQYKQ